MPRWSRAAGSGESRYSLEGKIERGITDAEFSRGLEQGYFVDEKLHRAYCVLLYYSAVRKGEALKVTPERFHFSDKSMTYDVGERFKHSKETPHLTLSYDLEGMEYLVDAIKDSKSNDRIFPFCPKTAYSIVRRVWHYPHLFRLSRITWFLHHGYTLVDVRSWTGLSLAALEYYAGIVTTEKMGEAMLAAQQKD